MVPFEKVTLSTSNPKAPAMIVFAIFSKGLD